MLKAAEKRPSSPARQRILLSWSGGKDSAWALHLLRRQSRYAGSGSGAKLGKSSNNAKGKAISVNHEMRNTDVFEDGGSTSSSVEAPVTGVEPSGRHGYMGDFGQLGNQEEL